MADHKSEPVSPSALIKVGGNNFFNMTDASGIDSLRAAAPAFHHNIDNALKASGKVRMEDPIVAAAQRGYVPVRQQIKRFKTGAPVIHVETGRKLTIIHASVGHTKKTHTPVHKCADKDGNVWDISESKLKLRM